MAVSIAAWVTVWICLVASKPIYGKKVTINSNGNSTTECCVEGLCLCSSMYTALSSIENNTIVNITSTIVPLTEFTYMGSGNLHNITITGNGATIMCNNSGSVYCESCNDVIIEGITWDHCGDRYYVNAAGIEFSKITNILFAKCTFQWSMVCSAIWLSEPEGNISIIDSIIQYNSIENVTPCRYPYSSLLIWNSGGRMNLTISGSVFHHNGHSNQIVSEGIDTSSLYCWSPSSVNLTALIENTVFSSNGIMGMYIYDSANCSTITVFNITVFNNSNGGVTIFTANEKIQLDILSSEFTYNKNGALILDLSNHQGSCNISMTNFTANKGTGNGVALHLTVSVNEIDIGLYYCKFHSNFGGESISYAAVTNTIFRNLQNKITITDCQFTQNKIGSALHASQYVLDFHNFNLFHSNSGGSGAAIYLEQNSQLTIGNNATVQFVNNTASVYGGAIYSDLANCAIHSTLIFNLSNYDSVSFVNNSAGVFGNSIYFNIPESCDVVRDETSNDSVVHIPNKFTYTQRRGTVGPAVATSPYEIRLCSPADCSVTNNDRSTCLIEGNKMLGQSIDFNATVCDYYNAIAEAVQFRMRCINCHSYYQLPNSEILGFNGSSNRFSIQATQATSDVTNPVNIALDISSVLPHEYKQLTATLSLTLSSCHSGFVFDNTSQQCECYKLGKDIIRCFEDHAEIKQGYWFGVFLDSSTVSICPTSYCNFVHQDETITGYYLLPEMISSQCSPHRRGPACGECSPGYSLSYDTPDCVSNDKCSVGITVLVVVLTMLYWIALIVIVLTVMYRFRDQISLGYLYGIIYFYSIVDIVLVDKLYISDGVFYIVAILSSMTNLSPRFLGKLCFVKDLKAIDQQFIHYFHVLCVWLIFAVILIVARYCNTVARYINRSIALFTGLLLLLSYTTVTSTSLQLLRALQYNDVDEVYVYLFPQMKYFTGRHAVYGSVALVCGLIIVLGFPVLLVVEPFLRQKEITIKKFIPVTKWLQDCYTDKYNWFAAYYLICRLVIMLIVYFANSDYSNMIYYLQTACVIITMTHVLIRPYKNDILNILDTMILLILLLVVNPSAFSFSQSSVTRIIVTLMLFSLCLVLAFGIYVFLKHHKISELLHFKTGETNQLQDALISLRSTDGALPGKYAELQESLLMVDSESITVPTN
ncbi:uncharacterized protein [Dysidea avara]|uniref:uncharacterized protein isoform X2 n=1 Tax=Dysidea avara TaxID=196820 RepID=UPI00331AC109